MLLLENKKNVAMIGDKTSATDPKAKLLHSEFKAYAVTLPHTLLDWQVIAGKCSIEALHRNQCTYSDETD